VLLIIYFIVVDFSMPRIGTFTINRILNTFLLLVFGDEVPSWGIDFKFTWLMGYFWSCYSTS